MSLILKNFASTLTTAAISTSNASITVASVATLPTLAAGDYFYAVITSPTDLTQYEIVKVTAISGNTLTVSRAQEGTTALAFPVGSLLEQRITAKSLAEYIPNSAGSYRGYQVYNAGKTLDINDAGKYIYCNVSGTVFNLPDGSSVPAGTRFSIQAGAAATNGIIVVSPVVWSGPNDIGTNNKTILSGGVCDFVSTGTGWAATNGAGYFSKGVNGYQAFPSGIILQWCNVTIPSSLASTSATWPIKFPNALLSCAIASNFTSSSPQNLSLTVINRTASGCALFNAGNTITGSIAPTTILALGY